MTEGSGKERRLKEIIAEELSQFLLKDDVAPERIKIEVHYRGSVARLEIKPERVKDIILSEW